MLSNLFAIVWQALQGFLTVVLPGLAIVAATDSTPEPAPAPAPVVVVVTTPDVAPVESIPAPVESGPSGYDAYAEEAETQGLIEIPAPADDVPADDVPAPAELQDDRPACWLVADRIVADGWTGSADEAGCFPGGEWDPAIEQAYGELERDGASPDVIAENDRVNASVRPCAAEDGTDVSCFWDSRKGGNGQGWSFYVDADGGITYATAPEYLPNGATPDDAPADVPPSENENGPLYVAPAADAPATASGR